MSLQAITEKIISDGEKRSRAITKEAEQVVSGINKELEEAKRAEQYEQETEALKKRNEDRIRTNAEAQVKEEREKLKRSYLDAVFRDAEEELNKLPGDKYSKLLTDLLHKITAEEAKRARIKTAASRRAETEQAVKDSQLPFQKVIDDENINSGLIVEGEDFFYDFRFHSLLQTLQSREETEIAKVLFADWSHQVTAPTGAYKPLITYQI